jgi:hypothetical protein
MQPLSSTSGDRDGPVSLLTNYLARRRYVCASVFAHGRFSGPLLRLTDEVEEPLELGQQVLLSIEVREGSQERIERAAVLRIEMSAAR